VIKVDIYFVGQALHTCMVKSSWLSHPSKEMAKLQYRNTRTKFGIAL